jgi:hypothetical protein
MVLEVQQDKRQTPKPFVLSRVGRLRRRVSPDRRARAEWYGRAVVDGRDVDSEGSAQAKGDGIAEGDGEAENGQAEGEAASTPK